MYKESFKVTMDEWKEKDREIMTSSTNSRTNMSHGGSQVDLTKHESILKQMASQHCLVKTLTKKVLG